MSLGSGAPWRPGTDTGDPTWEPGAALRLRFCMPAVAVEQEIFMPQQSGKTKAFPMLTKPSCQRRRDG